jgi:cytidylate kinase
LYRAVAYIFLKDSTVQNQQVLDSLTLLSEDQLNKLSFLRYEYLDAVPHVFYYDQDITQFLVRQPFWDQAASIVSAHAKIREGLLPIQREIGRRYNIIADGRDCGSIIFPHAEYKFYLTASVDARVARVCSDDMAKRDAQQIKLDILTRDKRDKERKVAPLRIPKGAFVIDNSNLTIEQTVETFLSIINKLL